MEKNNKINPNYQYENIDIDSFLTAGLDELRKQLNIEAVYTIPSITNLVINQLQNSLRDEYEQHTGPRTLLIPYNLGIYHWVGIIIRINEQNNVVVEYCDPLGSDEIPKYILKSLKAIYPNAIVNSALRYQQQDSVSCGPLTIENLLDAVVKPAPEKHLIKDTTFIRQKHLQWSLTYDINKNFIQRQFVDDYPVASVNEQLGYLKKLAFRKFSQDELARIARIIKYINNLSEADRTNLMSALSDKAKSKNHKEYLDGIRIAILQILQHKNTLAPENQGAIDGLLDEFFHKRIVEITESITLDDFYITFEELNAIGGINNITEFNAEEILEQISSSVKKDSLTSDTLYKNYSDSFSSKDYQSSSIKGSASISSVADSEILDSIRHKYRQNITDKLTNLNPYQSKTIPSRRFQTLEKAYERYPFGRAINIDNISKLFGISLFTSANVLLSSTSPWVTALITAMSILYTWYQESNNQHGNLKRLQYYQELLHESKSGQSVKWIYSLGLFIGLVALATFIVFTLIDNPTYATFANIAVIVATAVPSLAKKIDVAYIKHRADKAESAYRYPTPDLEKGQYLKELQPLLKATRQFFQDQIQQLETLQQALDENEKLKAKSIEDDNIIIQLDNERKQALNEIDKVKFKEYSLISEVERLKRELKFKIIEEIEQPQKPESSEVKKSKAETLTAGSAETTFFSKTEEKEDIPKIQQQIPEDIRTRHPAAKK